MLASLFNVCLILSRWCGALLWTTKYSQVDGFKVPLKSKLSHGLQQRSLSLSLLLPGLRGELSPPGAKARPLLRAVREE